jgi:hypothetical protein
MPPYCKGAHMAKQKNAGENDEGFMLAGYDWAGDIGATTGFGVRVVLTPTARRGVWQARAEAVSAPGDQARRVVAIARIEFPNGRATTLAAAMFALLTDLAVEIDAQSDGRN